MSDQHAEESTTCALRRLVAAARIEVLPVAGVEELILESLPPDRTVTIAASPGRGLAVTLELSERLARHGRPVVPHLAARMIRGRCELAEIVARFVDGGISRVFVPAGDAAVVGGYEGALELLRDLDEMGHPFTEIGITGYPESHPIIHDDVTVQAMWDKRHFATHVVSNLTFDPKVLGGWIGRVRARGVTTPILVGVPGPVQRAKLLAMATKIGVGESTRFLMKNRGLFGRLAGPGGFSGEKLLIDAAPSLCGARAQVAGLHVYSFNQVRQTEAWLVDVDQRLRAGTVRRLPQSVSPQ